MAVKQYIGARYVPQFADPVEWSAQAVYEPLTIVTYMFGSYTSKKAVPAGVLPTNTEYWAPTGNYNAQVEEYRQEVAGIKTEVDKITSNYNFKEDKFLFVTDSYGETRLDISVPLLTLIQNNLSIPEANISKIIQAGLGFHSSVEPSMMTILTNWISNNPDAWTAVNHVIFFVGVNDVNYTSEIVNSITAISNLIKQAEKTAMVIFTGCDLKPGEKTLLKKAQLEYVKGCSKNGVPIYNNAGKVLYNYDSISDDMIHPTNTGVINLANYCTQVILGHSPVWYGELAISLTKQGGSVTGVINNYTGDIKSATGTITVKGSDLLNLGGSSITLQYSKFGPELSKYAGYCFGKLNSDRIIFNATLIDSGLTLFFIPPSVPTGEWTITIELYLTPIS